MPMPGITAPDAQHFRSGLGVDSGRTSLPLLVPARAAPPADDRRDWVTSRWQQSRGLLDSDCDAMVSSTSSEKRPTRKELARRHLVGYIGKKVTSPTVSRNFSTNTTDRKRSPERVRPKRQDPVSPGRRRDVGEITLPHFRRSANGGVEENDISDDETEVLLAAGHQRNGHGRFRWTSSTTKQSGGGGSSELPGLMLHLNSELRRLEHGRHHDDRAGDDTSLDSDMECDVNNMLDNLAVHWDRNRRAKRMRENPCVTRHRPLTPSLLEKLDKLKLSSRTKTERWVSQLPTEKRAIGEEYCRIGPGGSSSVHRGHVVDNVSQEWLYGDLSPQGH